VVKKRSEARSKPTRFELLIALRREKKRFENNRKERPLEIEGKMEKLSRDPGTSRDKQ